MNHAELFLTQCPRAVAPACSLGLQLTSPSDSQRSRLRLP